MFRIRNWLYGVRRHGGRSAAFTVSEMVVVFLLVLYTVVLRQNCEYLAQTNEMWVQRCTQQLSEMQKLEAQTERVLAAQSEHRDESAVQDNAIRVWQRDGNQSPSHGPMVTPEHVTPQPQQATSNINTDFPHANLPD